MYYVLGQKRTLYKTNNLIKYRKLTNFKMNFDEIPESSIFWLVLALAFWLSSCCSVVPSRKAACSA